MFTSIKNKTDGKLFPELDINDDFPGLCDQGSENLGRYIKSSQKISTENAKYPISGYGSNMSTTTIISSETLREGQKKPTPIMIKINPKSHMIVVSLDR